MPTVWYSQTNVQHKVLTCKKTVRRKATRTLREMAWLAFSMLTRQPFKSNLWSQSYFGLCPLQIAVCFQFMSGQTTWVLDKYVFSVGLPIPIPINFNCDKIIYDFVFTWLNLEPSTSSRAWVFISPKIQDLTQFSAPKVQQNVSQSSVSRE